MWPGSRDAGQLDGKTSGCFCFLYGVRDKVPDRTTEQTQEGSKRRDSSLRATGGVGARAAQHDSRKSTGDPWWEVPREPGRAERFPRAAWGQARRGRRGGRSRFLLSSGPLMGGSAGNSQGHRRRCPVGHSREDSGGRRDAEDGRSENKSGLRGRAEVRGETSRE